MCLCFFTFCSRACVCVCRGVSMFAMLTGTLPFTVEPFNIKQLHQKMVNGEISSIPSDVSKGNLFHPSLSAFASDKIKKRAKYKRPNAL